MMKIVTQRLHKMRKGQKNKMDFFKKNQEIIKLKTKN